MVLDDNLKQKARVHYQDVKDRYKDEIADSVNRSVVYSPSFLSRAEKREEKFPNEIILTSKNSVSQMRAVPQGKTAILNYASYKKPGGLFLEGSRAQEESLCHESNLYPILEAFKENYYNWNNNHLNRGLYTDRAIYTPDVIFGDRKADVLTCAAPNRRVASKVCGVTYSENKQSVERRIAFIYKIAEENRVNTLIAGAWGCGVFGQNPLMVAEFFIEMAPLYNIPKIYLAIPDEKSYNYRAFLYTLEKNSRL